MNILDVIVVMVAALAAIWGYQFGFLTAVLSVGGLFVGLYLGARLVPTLLSSTHLTAAGARTLAALALAFGAGIGFSVGLAVGSRLHGFLPIGPLREADRGAGVGIAVIGVVVLLWLLLPSLAAVQGWPARASHSSAVARWVSRDLPSPPNAVVVLRRLFGGDTAPQVFSALQSGGAAGPPPANSPLSAGVTSTVIASTVKVQGQACNQIVDGSGFAVADNLVVTNAHVVAGEPRGQTAVLLPSGVSAPATVVLFDPERDLALLEVPGLGEQPLPIATGHPGTNGAVFGHPEGVDRIVVQPAAIDEEINAVGLDLYDRHNTTRDVFVLAARLAHGDSGAPLVSPSGSVLGVVFAVAADNSDTAYALTSSELLSTLSQPRVAAGVSTGSCLAG